MESFAKTTFPRPQQTWFKNFLTKMEVSNKGKKILLTYLGRK
jgi:hypothetical protein